MKTKIIPNDEVLKYYFYFMQERMNIFWEKMEGVQGENLTADFILKEYKFTNVYRATDRVSQYLIKDVIYKDLDSFTEEDTLFRILIFKIFNRIETWEYIEEFLKEPLNLKNFDVSRISDALTYRRLSNPIFSNAYLMTGCHHIYNDLPTKHERWLRMVKDEFVGKSYFSRILSAKSLASVYDILRNCPFIGDFLAYQYAIDFNYSPYLNFSENSFVKAGIGAQRGIKKCFLSYGDSFEDAIYFVAKNAEVLRQKYGFNNFKPLPGHDPTLIDYQNCFCETDKYLRAKLPELVVDNIKIKQKYKQSGRHISFYFPPKWNIKSFYLCTKPNI